MDNSSFEGTCCTDSLDFVAFTVNMVVCFVQVATTSAASTTVVPISGIEVSLCGVATFEMASVFDSGRSDFPKVSSGLVASIWIAILSEMNEV